MARISIPWKTYLHYKNRLNQQDKALYDAILDGVLEWKRKIPIPISIDATHVYNVFTMVLCDVPLLFHVSNGLRISMGSCCYVTPDYIMEEQTYNKHFASVVGFLEKCQRLLTKQEPFNKLQIIHDSIIKHVEYHNTESNNEHNILGTIIDKKAVCESIAKSYKILCDYNLIPAIVVFGYSDANNQNTLKPSYSMSSITPKDNHAWNIVKLDGNWYNIDLTFDVLLGNCGALKIYRYDYFLRSDQIFNLEHHASQRELLPQCPNDFNLYRRINKYVQTLTDVDAIIKAALKTKNRVKTIVFGVDSSSGLAERIIASTASTTCFFYGINVASYVYNVKTGVFCIILE